VRFDLPESVPANARAEKATLSLYVLDRGPETTPDPVGVSVHRLLAPWTEGAGAASAADGKAPTPGDSTWTDRAYPDFPWSQPGGDFSPLASSAVMLAGDFGPFALLEWSAPGLVADVQAWIDNPDSNHGWILISDESSPGKELVFRNRMARADIQRPRLIFEYGLASFPEWGSWKAINADGDLETDHLGWINIAQSPYIYLYSLDNWAYFDDPQSGWMYLFR
jgi:hypothetical protein